MKQRLRFWFRLVGMGILAAILAAGCAGMPGPPPHAPSGPLTRIAPGQPGYPRFDDDMDGDGLEHALEKSLEYLHRLPPDRHFTFAADRFDTAHMIRSIEVFLGFIRTRPSPDALREFVARRYRVYRSTGGSETGRVLFTGYFEPIIQGSPIPTERYRHPVYSRPADLVTIDLSKFSKKFKGETLIGRHAKNNRVVPYYDRQQIEEQRVLDGNAEELAWVDDPVDLFFLQVQGSGKVYLTGGQSLNVHYHTTNGRPYRSIGKLLIEQGAIARSDMSMQAIRRYLNDHPESLRKVLNYNPSYVFFKLEEDGPLGSLSVRLTPGRSIATDRRLFPKGALAFIDTRQPLITAEGRIDSWTRLSRFVLNQDTGGAIRGAGRADVFWGNGPYAEIAAGHMKEAGDLYFLILEPAAAVSSGLP